MPDAFPNPEGWLTRLPAEIGRHLARTGPSVVVWGGDVGELAAALSDRLTGCAVAASEFGAEPPAYDVAFVIDRLQGLPDPQPELLRLLAGCRQVCAVAVPHAECPLAPGSAAQFRRESFPDHLGLFGRIQREVYDDPDRGPTLLAVYATAGFRRSTGLSERVEAEAAKWDDYYAGLGAAEETPALRGFGEEFVATVADLLPDGGGVLEAGCGAGFQSLALARDGRFRVRLMDVSDRALEAARDLFARSGLTADSEAGDVFAPGAPDADLVFNAGVLEHYTFDQQVGFLKGMASRTRKYVLVLVPNRLCYWYWIWRIRGAAAGHWDYGKECPTADLSAAFRRAGLTFLGQATLGTAWTEDLIGHVGGLSEELRRDILAIHRSGILEPSQRGYLMAALGCVGAAPEGLPPLWRPAVGDDPRLAEVTAALADHTAMYLSADRLHRREIGVLTSAQRSASEALAESRRTASEELAESRRSASEALAESRRSAAVSNAELFDARQKLMARTYKLASRLAGVRRRLMPHGGWREHTVKALLGPMVRAVERRRIPTRREVIPGFELVTTAVRAGGRRPVVFLPSIRWTAVLFQRPQHMARELARLGHVVVYDCSGTDEPLDRIREAEPGVFLYKGPTAALAQLADPTVWAFTYNYHFADAYPADSPRVYDWIDDLAVFPFDPAMLAANHARGLAEATVVATVARRLQDRAAAVRPDALYLPNAVEIDRFADPAVVPAADAELDAFLAGATGVAGYYGALAAWFDYGLLKAVARSLPGWRFVLIGPDYDGSLPSADLGALPNIKWFGPRPYPSLPGYLKRFDVATIPFAINDITLATSPLKLFEYFAAGCPVVTTPMPECMAFPEVRVAATAEAFAAALVSALEEGRSPAARARLVALGRANSWAARAAQVSALLAPPSVPPSRRA